MGASGSLDAVTYANTRPDTLAGRTLRVKPIKINDGDTLWVAAELGGCCCCQSDIRRLHIRLLGIDSPELHPKSSAKGSQAYAQEVAAAERARAFVTELLAAHPPITARFHGREKFGRHLAELFLSDGRSVCSIMVERGHGVPYSGGSKTACVVKMSPLE